MNELSERLSQAVEFLKKNGYAKNDSAVSKRMGIAKSYISEVLSGAKVPGWGFLLDFCDAYPINFWWLRSGEGSMVKDGREVALLKRIEELEKMVEQLKE